MEERVVHRLSERAMKGLFLAVCLIFLVTGITGQWQVRAARAPKAYVGLFKDNAVAVIDTGTNQVLKTIPVPAGPHGLVITGDGKTVYVSSDVDSKVSVIDTASDTVGSTIEVGK